MKVSLSSHYSEEVLEKYGLGMLSGRQNDLVEEHLLVCATCRCRLEAVDEYIRVVKAAAAIQNAGPPGHRRRGSKTVYERELLLCS